MTDIVKNIITVSLLAVAATGCTRALGYAGQNPGYVRCTGKGVITATGSLAGGGGLGGGGANNITLQADCGPGFSFEQGPTPLPPSPLKSAEPAR